MTTLDYQNPRNHKRKLSKRWVDFFVWTLVAGVALAILAPSMQRRNTLVRRQVPVTVTDVATGMPLPNAEVTFENGADLPRTTTNATGIASVEVELDVEGWDAWPFYRSMLYSGDGNSLFIAAEGYVPKKIAIVDQKEFKILGLGSEPTWRFNVSLQSVRTTQPSQK